MKVRKLIKKQNILRLKIKKVKESKLWNKAKNYSKTKNVSSEIGTISSFRIINIYTFFIF